MDSIIKSESHSVIQEHTSDPLENIEPILAADMSEESHASSEDKEDIKFVSELGWLTAASVTIASVAQSIGIS